MPPHSALPSARGASLRPIVHLMSLFEKWNPCSLGSNVVLGMRVVSLGFHRMVWSRRSGELEGRRLRSSRRTELVPKRSRQPGRSTRWPDVLSEAAMERTGRDVPDAAVGADVAGHEVPA